MTGRLERWLDARQAEAERDQVRKAAADEERRVGCADPRLPERSVAARGGASARNASAALPASPIGGVAARG